MRNPKKTSSSGRTARTAPAKPTARKPFQSTDPAAAFAHFRPLASAVDVALLPVFNGTPALVLHNVQTAVELVRPELPSLAAKMVDPPIVEILELPALALALVHAAGRVPARRLSEGELRVAQEEVAPLRSLALKFLEVAADPLVGALPAERVRAVRQGSGPLDLAQDAVALASLFDEYGEALAGRHPFRPEQLQRMAELGALLLQNLKPSNAPNAPNAREPAAILRDQFAALLAARYDQLRVCATVAFGAARANALIPALRAAAPRAARTDDEAVKQPAAPVG